MAKCEEGYLCAVCGGDVESIGDSDLYLRFVVGMIDPEVLHTTPERHIRCNPLLAQFIVDPSFPAIVVEGEFDKHNLDPQYRQAREALITRGWRRLQELAAGKLSELSILDYRLPEFRDSRARSNSQT